VQGVNFRAAAAQRASGLQVTGRVWNRDDGAVELLAEGEPDALGAFARWLGEGPRSAQVSDVQRDDLPGEPAFSDFRIVDRPVR
jgi:acylphosphatase